MSFRKAILAAAALLLFTSPLYACPQQQSVAEAARKAREQKQKAPKAGKVITNDDLKPAPGPRGVSVIGSEPAPPAKEKSEEGKPTAGEEKAEKPEEPVKDEAYWRKRLELE